MVPTCEEISKFLKESPILELLPTQKRICGPRVQENIQRLIKGEIPPDIGYHNNLICNGHHRYIAAMMYCGTPLLSVWYTTSPALKWSDVEVDCEMWRFAQ